MVGHVTLTHGVVVRVHHPQPINGVVSVVVTRLSVKQ